LDSLELLLPPTSGLFLYARSYICWLLIILVYMI
jgi:hypothetical protein